jgi:endonuclease YncB( thermonuclease family)
MGGGKSMPSIMIDTNVDFDAPKEAVVLPVYRVDHFVDGDTIALRNGQRVRLVQIDAPEVF